MQWEYETIELKPSFWSSRVEAGRVKLLLNQMGSQGWELISSLGTGYSGQMVFILKRPVRPVEGSWPPPPDTV